MRFQHKSKTNDKNDNKQRKYMAPFIHFGNKRRIWFRNGLLDVEGIMILFVSFSEEGMC
jgi:hypothetical protein